MSALWASAALEGGIAATGLALVALLADRCAGRGRWPRLRLALWSLVALRLVLPPGMASPIGILPVGETPAAAPHASFAAQPPLGIPWSDLAFLGWAAGCVFLVARATRRHRRFWRWVTTHGRVAPEAARASLARWAGRLGFRRMPRLRVLPGLDSPAVAGLLRPVVLIPEGARGLDCALLHELTHLRRRDLWAQAGFSIVATLAWFHPVAWLARRRARALREIGCDLAAAREMGPRAPEYRQSLLEQAAARHLPERVAGALGWGSAGAVVLARLAALESGTRRAPAWQRAAGALTVAVLGALALPAAPGLGSVQAATPLEEARAHLARTFAERDRFGCFHRREAWFRMRALEDATASSAGGTP